MSIKKFQKRQAKRALKLLEEVKESNIEMYAGDINKQILINMLNQIITSDVPVIEAEATLVSVQNALFVDALSAS